MEESSNVTISLLPVSLSLVHIPRSRLPQLTHPILRQILQPKPTFFNVTCNEIELTLLAEHTNLADLDLIARQDRRRQRSRSGSGSSRKRTLSDDDNVEITCEHWNVLQIDSHSNQLDSSGARVHELSAPLAAAGISILYLSSYMSDFIFVKQSRLHQVMTLFRAAGFDLYSSDAEPSPLGIISPLIFPDMPRETNAHELVHEFSLESGAILTRSADACADPPLSSPKMDRVVEQKQGRNIPHQSIRAKSHSPSSSDVSILSTDLACVGLSDENMDNWALKIVKLVAFPDLIPLRSHLDRREPHFSTSNSLSKIPLPRQHDTIQIPNLRPYDRAGSLSSDTTISSSSDEADDGYFSHSPLGNEPTASFLSSPASLSYPDLRQTVRSMSPSFKPTSKHVVSPLPLSPIDSKQMRGFTSKPSSPFSTPFHRSTTVPFFSFTRTSEGSSLTTDVSVLAALFPPSERHMLICAGELDALENGASSYGDNDSEDSGEDEEGTQGGTLKCLQIDLRRFGLDKHGLVNRYSRVLEQNGINHMYSSTYKTANLLVAKAHASRARDLLRSC